MQEYPIGTPGNAWSDAEKTQWKEKQQIKRSYRDEVLALMPESLAGYSIEQYGALPYDESR